MKKSYQILIVVAITLFLGWAMYLYYDLIQLKKTSIAEIKEIEKNAMAELLKPKGHIGLENKSNKHSVIKITNNNNDLIYWKTFTPGGSFASYGTFDAGIITLELMRNDNDAIHTVKFELNKGGDANFYVYKDKIKPQ